MKMGTTRSPWRYDAAIRHALQSANLRWPAILHYASSAAVSPISQGGPVYPSIAVLSPNPWIDVMCRFCCKSRRFQLQMGWLDLLERPLSSALRGRWHYRLVLTPALVTQDVHPLLAVVERSASRACEDSAQSLPV